MNKTLIYLFDPLCGWCYGAGGPLPGILEATGLRMELVPTGLFSGEDARPMDDSFAEYAWRNDQRIQRLTGQVFSEGYREQVLGAREQMFDSGPATVALTAVSLSAPEREYEVLKDIQHARYVDGLDITQVDVLVALLNRLELSAAANRLAAADEALLAANQARTARGRRLLRDVGGQGVPTFVLLAGGHSRALHSSAIFSNPQAFVAELSDEA